LFMRFRHEAEFVESALNRTDKRPGGLIRRCHRFTVSSRVCCWKGSGSVR
jgi:hypothetical protein